eukprot:symbB.v1.2.007123.t1/scaffold430.1/size206084/18
MAHPASKRWGELVRQAGQLHMKPEHMRAEAEKELFGEVKLGLLVSEALESEDLAADDMAAMLRLIVSCGSKKRLASRAAEFLSKILQSRSWSKVVHCDAKLLEEMKSFISENPEAGELGEVLDKDVAGSKTGAGVSAPIALDDESRRLILEPLQEGHAIMAKCKWRFTGDDATEGFSKFLRGITRLSGAASRTDGGACIPPLLEWLDSDWSNIIAFLSSMHETKKLSRSQVETCVKMLRSLSHHFADIENNTEGLPWRTEAKAIRLPAMLVSRSVLKKQSGCGSETSGFSSKKPSGRAFRRKMLVTAIHRISDSPMPTASSTGTGRLSDCEDRVPFDTPKKIGTPTDSDSETMSTMTRLTSLSGTDCESLSA